MNSSHRASTWRVLRAALSLVALGCVSTATLAQSFPSRPVRWIIPFPPGGSADLVSRAVAQKLSDSLGQPVVVENRPGAGGAIGLDAVAKAAPDGHTLGLGAPGAVVVNVHMSKLPYDPLRDLYPVSRLAIVPVVLAANPSQPYANLREFIAFAKANPKKLSFGSTGTGSVQHLGGELLKVMAGIDMVHVPYKGSAPAASDLAGGQLPVAMIDLTSALPHIRSGRIRALAVAGSTRTVTAPDIATMAEQGLTGYDADGWLGMFGPANMPADVVAKLNAETARALQAADVRERTLNSGAEPSSSSAEEFGRFVRAEHAKWGKLIREAGIKAE